jgi:threonine dehydrogenase-like Zn-dependent dehydrogenase
MRRLILTNPREVRLESCDDPGPPRGRDVLIAATLSLVSVGTERRLYLGDSIPSAVNTGFQHGLTVGRAEPTAPEPYRPTPASPAARPTYPTSLGYNTVGVVREVGPDVTGLRPGDRVMTVGPHRDLLLLSDWEVAAIPAELPDDQAVLSYLATLGLSAFRRMGMQPGHTVVVAGLGVVGLTAALVSVACGARTIGVDPNPYRRTAADAQGRLTAVLDPTDPAFDALLQAAAAPGPVDHVIETAGTEASLADAIRIVRRRGTIGVLALFSAFGGGALADLFHEKQCALVSCANERMVDPQSTDERFSVMANIRTILDLMRRGQLSFAGLVTHTFDVDEAAKAYRLLDTDPESPFLGVALRWS